MKRIQKMGKEPSELTDWIKNFRSQEGREPRYKDFRETPEWYNLIQTLLKEQGYICCYCMKEIQGWDSHIEHFIPRTMTKKDPHSIRAQDIELSYFNMLESCNGEYGDRLHCGRFKDSESSPMILSPTDEKIEERFSYNLLNGEIEAADAADQEAMTTIRILNLNSEDLKGHRLSAFYSSGILEVESDDERDDLIDFFSIRDSQGAFAPYCAALVWALKNGF